MAGSSTPPVRNKARELQLRLVSGLALAGITLFIIWQGGLAYIALVAVVTLLAVDEWLLLINGRRLPFCLFLAIALLAICGAMAATMPAEIASLCLGLAVAILFLGGVAMGAPRPAMSALGLLYIGGAAVALIYLRAHDDGRAMILFLMLCVWATDTGAYAVGRFVGGYRLWPAISPAKTWAGVFGGMMAAAIIGASFAVFFAYDGAAAAAAALAAILVAIAAIAGDLLESKLKRLYNAKDSGSLIPGHGGVLDRIDGLLAATLIFALIAGFVRAEVFA